MMNNKPRRIVIVGGGAGGLELAARLGRKLGKKKLANITLVDQSLTHIWKPLLHEVAAGTLNSHKDELNFLALAHNNYFTFQFGKMHGLNRGRKKIILAPVMNNNKFYIKERTLDYDNLVIAVGSKTNSFGVKGVEEFCMYIDSREEADEFHKKLIQNAIKAHSQDNTEPFNIAIAGAGATGVELSAELHEALDQFVKYGLYNAALRKNIRIYIIEAADRILPALPPRLSEITINALHKIQVKTIINNRIIEANSDGFITDKSGLIQADIRIWAAGIKAPDFLKDIDGLETNSINQLIVSNRLQTTQDESIFAIGDCAACYLGDTDNTVPPRAQAAHQQAATLIKSFDNLLQDKPAVEYHYTDYGSLVNLSRYTTVGNIMGNLLGRKPGSIMFEGVIARIIYKMLYKTHLVLIQGFFQVCLDTIINIINRKTKPRIKLH